MADITKTRREAATVARIFGAPAGANRSEQAEALVRGLKMAGASPRQIKKAEDMVQQIRDQEAGR